MRENELSYIIREPIFNVYNTLGPRLLESVYVAAVVYELTKAALRVKTEVPLPVIYEDKKLDLRFRIDTIVNDLMIIEVKSIELLAEVYHKIVLTYLKLPVKKLAILLNFNRNNIAKSIFRKANKL